MTRLSLVCSGEDRELESIRRVISQFEAVAGLDDVIVALRARAARGDRVEVLDAIGHSLSPGFVVLGTWMIDDTPQTAATFRELLRPALERLGVRTIRLIGCSTATSHRGRSAMRRIAQATGCDVLGTRRYVSVRDHAAVGFVGDDALASLHHAAEPEVVGRERARARVANREDGGDHVCRAP